MKNKVLTGVILGGLFIGGFAIGYVASTGNYKNNTKVPIENKKLSFDEKLNKLKTKEEIFEQKNNKGENLFSNKLMTLTYNNKDKDIEKLLTNVNNITKEVFKRETNVEDMFDNTKPTDEDIKYLGVRITPSVSHINKDSVVIRITEEGQLGATSMYGFYYYTFDKNTMELIPIKKSKSYVLQVKEKLIDELKKHNETIENTYYNKLENLEKEMYRDGNWYIKDDKYIFIIETLNYLPQFEIEVTIKEN